LRAIFYYSKEDRLEKTASHCPAGFGFVTCGHRPVSAAHPSIILL